MLSTLSTSDLPVTRSNNPFEAARLSLIQRLLQAKAPGPISTYPFACEFLAVKDHVVDFSKIFSEWLEEIGHQVSVNATHSVDMSVFTDTYVDAVQGNATFEIEEVAEAIRCDQDEDAV